MSSKSIFALVALAMMPALAWGSECRYESVQELPLDLDAVSVLQISIGPDQLALRGREAAGGSLRIRQCASTQERLDKLGARLVRGEAGRLVLELDHGGSANVRTSFFGLIGTNEYGRFEIEGELPVRLAVDVTVGSGRATIDNVAALQAVLGSGRLEVSDVAGELSAVVGSGKLWAEDVGRLRIGSIGSGGATVERVGGDARVDNIGSGSAQLSDVDGAVSIGAIGSGSAALQTVAGDVEAHALGSGNIDARGVGGGLVLRSKGSGSVSHRDVAGSVSLPNR